LTLAVTYLLGIGILSKNDEQSAENGNEVDEEIHRVSNKIFVSSAALLDDDLGIV